ncbi:transposase [Brevibacterium sp. UCMA 11752]|nr:transposase [Brevibacterium sp. UCMA 11752]
MIRCLDANTPATLETVRALLRRFRDHYNNRRHHQSIGDVTPATAWSLLAYTPATEPS